MVNSMNKSRVKHLIVITCFAWIIVSLTAVRVSAQGAYLDVGPKIQISEGCCQYGVTVSIDPNDPNTLFVVSADTSGPPEEYTTGTFAAYSDNRGADWTTVINDFGYLTKGTESSVAWDDSHNAFVVLGEPGPIGGPYDPEFVVYRWNDGDNFSFLSNLWSNNWEDPSNAIQPKIAIGDYIGWIVYKYKDKDNVWYICAKRFDCGWYEPDDYRYSHDRGIKVIGESQYDAKIEGIAVSPGGGAVVAYQQGNGIFACGFQAEYFIPDCTTYIDDGESADIAYDFNSDKVYLVYCCRGDIFIKSSGDNGGNWSDRVCVNEGVETGTKVPSIAVDPATGNIAVVWYDGRIFATVSTDGGSTFLPSVSVSGDDSYEFNDSFHTQNGGLSTDVAFCNGCFHPVWSGDLNIFTAKVCLLDGDLDGDGDVDYDDYLIFRTAFGSCRGDDNFIPGADLDGDGCITIRDLKILRTLVTP